MREDFISDMLLKFCISASKFDKKQGFKFSTFAHGGFDMGKTDLLGRKIEKYKKYHFVEKKKILKNKAKKEYEEINNELLKNFIENEEIEEQEKNMLIDYYFNNLNFSRLGEKYNFSKEWTRKVVEKGLRKLKRIVRKEHLKMEDFYEAKSY